MTTKFSPVRHKQPLLSEAIVEQLRNELRPLIKEAVAAIQSRVLHTNAHKQTQASMNTGRQSQTQMISPIVSGNAQ